MAWRGSRSHRRRLLLFVISISFGIAAIVSIGSFGANIERAIDEQARALLGADLMFSSLRPFPAEIESVIDSLGGEQVREFVFGSMASFPRVGASRLVQVRAIDGAFPFYGEITTEPAQAAGSYQTGVFAIADENLLLQLKADIGDTVRLGRMSFVVSGRITQMPSEPPIASTFSPAIFVAARYLPAMDLMHRGSLVYHHVFFKFDDNRDAEAMVEELRPRLDAQRIRAETVASRKQRISTIMEDLYGFLNLVGFVALVLGSLGVASAVHVYIKQKLKEVAILRCVGAKTGPTFLVYLLQVLAMAMLCALLGAAGGYVVQAFLPSVLADFLPVQIEAALSWSAVFQGAFIGLSMAILFALAPLLAVRRVTPLMALRASAGSTQPGRRDWSRAALWGTIGVVVTGFFIWQSAKWIFGVAFAGGVLVALLVLAGVARLITAFFRRFFPRSWPYAWRQGLANLYRPNNQTLILLVSVGLGTFLITTLFLTQHTLLDKVTYAADGDRTNLIMYDIQPDQLAGVVALVRKQELPLLQAAPMVTMRLAAINGESIQQILSDTTRAANRGLLRWEYRATYRDSLFDSETIIAGHWRRRVRPGEEIIPISFEESAARRLQIALGDTLVWDVQGLPLPTRIASLRKVDWQRLQANFMVVFPVGALEEAPQIFILATRTPSGTSSATLQRSVVDAFPNVSLIDLKLVLQTLDSLLDKISFAIRFMAFFSIFAGLLVLAAAVTTSRLQRVQEAILLRTLGASRRQVQRIMLIEYLFLGGFAALTGLVLAYGATWVLAVFLFESSFLPTFLPFAVVATAVVGLTVFIGMMNSRGILDRPPLEILRAEG